jgi:hypothetical protein
MMASGASPLHSILHGQAVLLVAGDKSGVSQKRFYKTLIAKADKRFDAHLAALAKKEN